MVGLARVVLFRRERIMMLEPRDKGIVATSLHYANEVHAADAYFDEIPDIELPKQMLELAKHIIEKMTRQVRAGASSRTATRTPLIELIRSKQKGMPVKPQPTHRQANVINLMDALRRSVEGAKAKRAAGDGAKKPRSGAEKADKRAGATARARQGQGAQRRPGRRGAMPWPIDQLPRASTTRSATSRAPRSRAASSSAQARRSVRRAQARRAPAALRPAPRARRRAEELGRHPRAQPVARRTSAWRCASRTTRSTTPSSRAASPRASTAPAASSSGTAAAGRPRATRTSSSPRATRVRSEGQQAQGRWHLVHMKGRDSAARRTGC